MKYLIFILTSTLMLSLSTSSYAQFDLLKKIKKKVDKRVEKKTDETIDKGLDEVEKGAKNSDKKDSKKEEKKEEKTTSANTENTSDKSTVNTTTENKPSNVEPLKSFSKYDFIPGEKVIGYEDFSQDAVGDFPAAWYTNGSGEVVTLNNFPGHWLMFRNNSKYVFRLDETLPENYTIEFDFLRNVCDNYKCHSVFYIASIDKSQNPYNSRFPGMQFEVMNSIGLRLINFGVDKFEEVNNSKEYDLLKTNCGKPIKFSIWVQKQRLRIYINEEKIYDIPKFMPKDKKMNTFIIEQPSYRAEDKSFFFSNLRIAVGAPDMRNKLLTEGKLVTHGILFDVNSDKIKPESYGTLKEIAQVLQENSSVNVKIIGHTDSDGSDASNLDLSKKRAVSVKNTLVSEFGLADSRMVTDGKGESEPISDNNTIAGKANNRRVEFIKTN